MFRRGPLKVLIVALLAGVGAAHATQPPDGVTSDANGNTAMGTNALSALTTGSGNPAAGFQGPYSNTNGKDNTTGSNSDDLQQLRPVTFHLKPGPKGVLQYGLIAEEVAQAYPQLVVRDSSGRIDGARYGELAPMFLNEAQQQQRKIATHDQHSAAQDAKINDLEGQLAEMRAELISLQRKDAL